MEFHTTSVVQTRYHAYVYLCNLYLLCVYFIVKVIHKHYHAVPAVDMAVSQEDGVRRHGCQSETLHEVGSNVIDGMTSTHKGYCNSARDP